MANAVTADMSDSATDAGRRVLAQIDRALGSVVGQALADHDVTDILRNADGTIWIERLGQPLVEAGYLSANEAMTAINAVAGWHQVTITPDNPVLSCELPDGSRFEANIPPVAVGGPTFSIRKKASRLITLDEYVATGGMTGQQKEIIHQAVTDHSNILIAGSTGSGKTTLANAIIHHIVEQFPHERLYILEDLTEIQCNARNKVVSRATRDTTMVELLRSALRQRPDRILIGEVRGGEAWELVKCWNTGHPGGVCTIHADATDANGNATAPALKRLEQLCAENAQAPRQTGIIRDVIAEAVDLLVYIARHPRSGQRTVLSMTPVGVCQRPSPALVPAS